MDLLEYQAKELFSQVGIPVLPSQPIEDPRKLKRLHIPYPVVLKSQVRAGGRGRAGGIRFVENTIDAIAAARTIFNLPILDEYPQVLLALLTVPLDVCDSPRCVRQSALQLRINTGTLFQSFVKLPYKYCSFCAFSSNFLIS